MGSTQHAHDEHKTVCVYLLPSPKHASVDYIELGWASKVIVDCIVNDTFIGFALMQVSLPHYSGQGAKSNEGMVAFPLKPFFQPSNSANVLTSPNDAKHPSKKVALLWSANPLHDRFISMLI